MLSDLISLFSKLIIYYFEVIFLIIYTVQKGDNLYNLSKQFKTSTTIIAKNNGLNPNDTLIVGQNLIISNDTSIHVVMPGESLYSISVNYGLSLKTLLDLNPQITKPYTIYPGQEIFITKSPQKKYRMTVNGYLFPNSNLDNYLPDGDLMTFGSVFTYSISENGSLLPFQDEATINRLKRKGIQPIMVVTNTDNKGSFSSSLSSLILQSQEKRERLINEIYRVLNQNNYYGINVDFEYVKPDDKEKYITFLTELRNTIGSKYELSVALAPKYSADQQGLLYEAHDYQRIGKIADRVIIMTYEWGYTYGPAMPVAPLDLVEKVIKYASQDIDPKKINLGIPTYGYDFVVPFKKGNKARSLSYEGAIRLAREENATIQYKKEAETPFFTYYSDGIKHEVYYEDAKSIEQKIVLADKYHLGGISFWTLRSPFVQMWTLIDKTIDVIKYK